MYGRRNWRTRLSKELFDIFDGHPFDGDHCFLCGAHLTLINRTEEHVFPRWLQDAFDLRDRTITLLNNTRIPYRNLVIPCCSECNGVHLSQLENRVRAAFLDESKSLDEIDDQELNAWLSKIYIGILWKELELSYDRRNPDAGRILPPEVMTNFRMVHLFMQSCRKKMRFSGLHTPFPNSLLRVECKVDSRCDRFDYLDSSEAHSVAIRLGNKGVLAIFDGGLHSTAFPDFANMQFDRRPLHPAQFKEIFAKLTYKSTLSLRVPFFTFIYDEVTDIHDVCLAAFDDEHMLATVILVAAGDEISLVPVLPDSALDGPAYSEWSQEEYARVLSIYSGVPFEQLFVLPDLVVTVLRDDSGEFRDISCD